MSLLCLMFCKGNTKLSEVAEALSTTRALAHMLDRWESQAD
jgi:hypothetical protein